MCSDYAVNCSIARVILDFKIRLFIFEIIIMLDIIFYLILAINIPFITKCNNVNNSDTMYSILQSAKVFNNEFANELKDIIRLFQTEKNLLLYNDAFKQCEEKIWSLFDQTSEFIGYDIKHHSNNNHTVQSFEEILMKHNEYKQVITAIGNATFAKSMLQSAITVDRVLKRHDVFVFSCKWIIITESDCHDILETVQPFYHVLCIAIVSRNKDMCNNLGRVDSISTLVSGTTGYYFQTISIPLKDELNKEIVFPNTKYRLNSRHFFIGTVTGYNLFAVFDKDQNKTIYKGRYADVTEQFARYLNMSYTILPPSPRHYGHQFENGSWSGLVGQLLRDEIDFAIDRLSMNSARRQVVDFADYALEQSVITGMYKRPPSDVNALDIILSPFTTVVWILLMVSVFIFAFIVAAGKHIWHTENTLSCRDYIRIYFISVTNEFYISFHSFFGEEITIKRVKAISLRLIWTIWLIYGSILVCVWSANIISHLTIPKNYAPFETSYELLDQNTYRYGVDAGRITEVFFAASKRYPYKDMYEHMKQWDSIYEDKNLQEKAQKEKFVYFTEFFFRHQGYRISH